jgi:serine/threonine protein kinase/tetratricopeptide (TPR) repeat protein
MRTGLALVREGEGVARMDHAVRRLEDEWTRGEPNLKALWGEADPEESISVLVAMVKADLGCRFTRGERPAAADYLERFPALRSHDDRVLSLVYEEYCLREERGERPDTEEFCERYAPWKDSLASQLRYHRVISRVAGLPPAPPQFPQRGERFQEFLICEELGRGGAARVYRALDESLGEREVALKVSHDRGSEPSILGQLEHPHIVTVHSVAVEPETKLRGLCMPYRPGLPLDEVIRRVNPDSRPRGARALVDVLAIPSGAAPKRGGWESFPLRGSYAEGVAWVAATLAEALAYAHAKKIYHRDVKPANVLLTYGYGPQLLDFNLSHDPHSAEQAEAALRGGTLPYMAPEQLEAFLEPKRWDEVVGQADLYSLGLLMRELLTGLAPETPDPALPLPRAIRALLDRRVEFHPGLRQVNPKVPHALEAVVERCLSFAPGDRYHDAGELAEDLRLFLAHRPLKHVLNPSRQERSTNWVRRHRLVLAVAAAAMVALAVSISPAVAERLAPIEKRTVFLKAVKALDEDRKGEALRALTALGAEAERSPVAGFYLGTSLVLAEDTKNAAAVIEGVWGLPGAEAALTAWGKSRPAFARHAETLGRALLNRNLRKGQGPKQVEAVLDLAGRTLRLAVQIDPGRDLARQGLALIDEIKHDYPRAHKSLTALIAAGTADDSEEGRDRLRSFLQSRARVSTRWGLMQLATPCDADRLPRLAALFREGLADLDREEKLLPAGREYLRFDLTYVRCEATLALADVSAMVGDKEQAVRHYRLAAALLDPLSKFGAEQRDWYQTMRKKVLKRVESQLPKLQAPSPKGSTDSAR